MPIPIEKIQVVEDEIEREHDIQVDNISDDDDDRFANGHATAMTPPDQDFSFLRNSHQKRSVHYGDESNDDQECRPFRTTHEIEQPQDNVLRRRYIAHWGLPGKLLYLKLTFKS